MRTSIRNLLLLTAALGLLPALAPATSATQASCEDAVKIFRRDLEVYGGLEAPEVASSMSLALTACPPAEDAIQAVSELLPPLDLTSSCPPGATAYESHIQVQVVVIFHGPEGDLKWHSDDDGPGYYKYDPGIVGYTQEFFAQGFRSSYALLSRDNGDAWIFAAGQPIEAPQGGFAEGGCIGSPTPCWAQGFGRAVRNDFTVDVRGDFNRCG